MPFSARLALVLALALSACTAHAEPSGRGGYSLSSEIQASGSEYVSGNFPGAILMPVNLWGAVSKPGIHHIPIRTDIVTLLSLAGGPAADAKLDDITIKRRSGGTEKIIRVDADDILTGTNVHAPVLEPNDIILIPKSTPTVPSDLASTLGFVGTIMSLVMGAIVLGRSL